MAEDGRAVGDLVTELAALKQIVEDLRTTAMARMSTRPTGSMEDTLAATPPAGTLLLQGQTLSRLTYAALWRWVGVHSAAGFGVGDGSTTFVLPDMRGRILIAAGTLGTDTYAVGDLDGIAFRSILTGNMPSHNHGVGGSYGHSGHSHAIFGSGNHGGHFPGSNFSAAAGTDLGLAAWNSGGNSSGTHDHGMTVESPGNHTINESSVGSGTALDIRQPSFAVNRLIYT